MLVNVLGNPVNIFLDSKGQPLQGGSIYIGQPNTDPTNTANQITVFQDNGLTIPLTQPIKTLNGQPAMNGSQAVIYLGLGTTSYSLAVLDAGGVVLMSIPSVQPFSLGGNVSGSAVVKKFVAGTDFTAGTTTSLQLSANFGSGTNLFVDFDGVPQHYPDDFTLSGTTLTFTAPIPVGTQKVYTKGGTTAAVGTPGAGTVLDAAVGAGSKLYNRLTDFLDLRDPAYGAICNGTTDDTAAVQRAINAIGSTPATLIIPGPTLISGALTFSPNTQLFPLNGGYFIGKVGTEVIQLQSAPLAGPVPLFLNMAAVATNGMTVYPEWFGAKADGSTADDAAIQLAINFLKNTGGIVQFDARTYILSVAVNIGTALAGSVGQNTVLQGKGRHSTILRTTSATTGAIQVLGAAGTALQGISIREMTIDKSVTGTGGVGIYLQYTAAATLYNIQVNNYLLGVSYLRATNTIADKVTVTFNGTTNNWHGFDLNGGGTGAGGNASSVFRDCYVQGLGTMGTGVIGFYAYGAYVSDLMFLACETASIPIGYEFDMSASVNTGNEDVQLVNCRADGITTYGVYVNGAGTVGSADSMVTILGGWYDAGNVTSEIDLIHLTNCQGIVIEGAQLYNAPAEPNVYGVYMTGCSGCTVLGNTFREMKYSVYSTGGRGNMVKGNNIYNAAATPGTQQAVMLSESYSSIQGNTFRGTATNGAVIDAASTSCSMIDNIADPANITTRYSNSALGTSFTANNIGA